MNPVERMMAKQREAALAKAEASRIAAAPTQALQSFVMKSATEAPRIPTIKPMAHNFAFMQSIARKAESHVANVKGQGEEPKATNPQGRGFDYGAIAARMEAIRLSKEEHELELDHTDDWNEHISAPVLSGDRFTHTIEDMNQFNILEGVQISLDPSQQAACYGLAREPMGCLIGAAGTGKTTTTRFLMHTLIHGAGDQDIEALNPIGVDIKAYHEKTGVHLDDIDDEDEYNERMNNMRVIPAIAMVAFTGQATQVIRKNMPESWHSNIMTIHSLLGYHPVEFDRGDGTQSMRFEPYYTKFIKMPWVAIFIDEASMVNVDLWHQLRDAARDDCRFYFIGDLNQLTPPIGQGILGFALAKLPTFELTVVHRQKEAAANRIVDTAWAILKGQPPVFDDPSQDPNWRVIGFKLNDSSRKAHEEVISIARHLAAQKVSPKVDPTMPLVYDPYRDRIMTPMNGFNSDDPASLMGQYPINEALALLFAIPEEPRIIIDAKKSTKKFAVGYRIMATKNEPPDAANRVTNGLTGRIIAIEDNEKWSGDRRLVGEEESVKVNRAHMLDVALGRTQEIDSELPSGFTFTAGAQESSEAEERQGGPASHYVHIKFDNGATRAYGLNAQVDQLQLAYASTTHKAQGAEMPTAIIVVHQASRRMLCRENLYTAVTRAAQRVIILYTDQGMKLALNTQKIYGSTLKEKIQMYLRFLGESEDSGGFKFMDVRLYPDNYAPELT